MSVERAGGQANVHAGLIALEGCGILVTGPARSGKSSLIVCLLRAAAREGRDAALIADDRVVLERRGETLYGSAPAPLRGLIELSGIGLLRVATRAQAELRSVVAIEAEIERMPARSVVQLLGVQLPRVFVPPRQAPFAADLVLTLHAAGYDALLKT